MDKGRTPLRKLQDAIIYQAIADVRAYLSVRARRKNPLRANLAKTSEGIEAAADAARWLFGPDRHPEYLFSRTRACGDRDMASRLWFSFGEQERIWLLSLLEAAGVRLSPSLKKITA